MAYKISASGERELTKAINKFNAKVKRLESVDREIDIPEKANISAIKDRVTNKWELNREIDKLERFTQKNAEDLIKTKGGLVISKWEYENLQREQKRLSARLLREIERYGKITPTEFGEKQAVSYARMGDDKYQNLKARQKAISNKKLSKINVKQFKRLTELINRTNANYRSSKKQIFYNNFLDGTLLNLGYITEFDQLYDIDEDGNKINKLDYIRKKLGELSTDQFIKAFNSELSLRYIQEKNNSPDKDEEELEMSEKEIAELKEDLIPVLNELYNNIDTIVDTYK